MNGLPDMKKNIEFLEKIKDELPCHINGERIKAQELCREHDCPLVELFRSNIEGIGFKQSIEIKFCVLLEKLRREWETKMRGRA